VEYAIRTRAPAEYAKLACVVKVADPVAIATELVDVAAYPGPVAPFDPVDPTLPATLIFQLANVPDPPTVSTLIMRVVPE
jgi:hypothetical protein